MDELGGKNPYEILELKEGPASTDQDIKKASSRKSDLKFVVLGHTEQLCIGAGVQTVGTGQAS